MAPRLVTTAHLQTSSKAARDELITIFKEITDYAKSSEPGVHRYITAVPIDSSNETSIYMIEEYADQEASDSHLRTAAVQKLIAHMGSSPSPLAGAPEIFNLAPWTEFRKPLEPKDDTLLILAHVEYKRGNSVNALKGWESFVEYCKTNEPETIAYTIMEDKENNTIRTVEVYENKAFVNDVHAKSAAFMANQEQNGANGTGVKGAIKLRIVQGFLGK